MNKIVVDTNIIVGLYDKKDVWHKPAKKLLQRFEENSVDLILLDCVANETFTVLARRLRERKDQKEIVQILTEVKTSLPKEKIVKSYKLLETDYEGVINRII